MNISLRILMDAFFIGLTVWCAAADLRKRLVPNLAVVLLLCIGAIHVGLVLYTQSAWWLYPAGFALSIPYLIVWLKDGIGAGDVKLLMAVGLYLGLVKTLAAFVLMLPILVIMAVRSWTKHRTLRFRIPLAPVICAGTVGVVALEYLALLI